ncbi:hypothetical protein [Streptomyces sp. NPDC002172]
MSATALDAYTLEKLVAAAVAAPSVHNTQPRRFRLDLGALTLQMRAATERALRHTDPTGRALHVSVGCALFNLRVAAVHFGWKPVPRLLPRPEQPDLLATVRLAGASRTSVPQPCTKRCGGATAAVSPSRTGRCRPPWSGNSATPPVPTAPTSTSCRPRTWIPCSG